MKPHLPIMLAVAAAWAPESASAQLIGERVENSQRVCVYRDSYSPAEINTYRVGLGEACAANPPTARSNLRAPPTARLASTSVQNGRRLCAYSQRNRSWTFEMRVDARCPMNAGALIALQSTDDEPED